MDAGPGASDEVDDQALTLRSQGRSFGAIADALGLGRAVDANRAFNRALRRQSPEERSTIRTRENRRLDRMVEGIQADTGMSPDAAQKRLRTIERLRDLLMAD